MVRNKSLDVLRGLAAISIMIYHFSLWTNNGNAFSSNSFLGRIGLYGVSIFYVLSGLTMYLVYKNKLDSKESIKSFFTKRVFRIFPLYWLVCILSIIFLKSKHDLSTIFLNFSGLFAFLNSNSMVIGGWSIGNELVFYSFFPIIMLVLKKSTKLFYSIFALSIVIGLFFAFIILSPTEKMVLQWKHYVNPFNQLYFFIAGIWLGTLSFSITPKSIKYWVLFLIFCALIFVILPSTGEQPVLITGLFRIVFSILSIAICYLFYVLNPYFTKFTNVFLTKLGEISYGVYLLHPLCFFEGRKLLNLPVYYSQISIISIFGMITIFLSYLIYIVLEKPMIKMGKHIIY